MSRARNGILIVAICTAALVANIVYAQESFVEFAREPVGPEVSTCLPGEVPITSATRLAARAAGYSDEITCWRPEDPNIGLAAGTAKLYLRNMLCSSDRDNYGGAGADGTIAGLNAKFAVCAATFLKAASAEMTVCIREGYRTEEKQQEYADRYRKGTGGIACNPASKQCEHPSGIAIDVNVLRESDYQRLWAMAPQYGLSFYLREKDKYHFVPTKEGCIALSNPSGNAARDLPIEIYDFKQHAPTVNPFQNPNIPFFMPPMQQQQQRPPQQSAPYMQPASAPSIPASPSLPSVPVSASPTPSTPATVPTSVNPATSSTPVTPNPAPTDAAPTPSPATAPTPTTPATPEPATKPQETERPAWIDAILSIAKFDSAPIVDEAPVPLVPSPVNSGEISHLESSAPRAVPSQPTIAPIAMNPPAVQTFTSRDLSTSPRAPTPPAQYGEISRMLTSLAQLRTGLEKFLGVAQPPRSAQDAARWYPS